MSIETAIAEAKAALKTGEKTPAISHTALLTLVVTLEHSLKEADQMAETLDKVLPKTPVKIRAELWLDLYADMVEGHHNAPLNELRPMTPTQALYALCEMTDRKPGAIHQALKRERAARRKAGIEFKHPLPKSPD